MPRHAARELGGSRCLTVTVCLGNEAGGHNVAIRLTIGLLVEGSLTEASKFLAQLFEQRDLVTDPQPSKMEERRERLRPDHTVRITCFATARRPATTSIRRATRSTRTCTASRTTGVGHRSRRR